MEQWMEKDRRVTLGNFIFESFIIHLFPLFFLPWFLFLILTPIYVLFALHTKVFLRPLDSGPKPLCLMNGSMPDQASPKPCKTYFSRNNISLGKIRLGPSNC